jgi:mRNA-degrading endonuclease RelE of RelBE toxin-antitoxin system
MSPYNIFLRLEAAEAIRVIRGAQRTRISAFIDLLANDPFQVGEYTERDESDRQIEIKVIGQYAIIFWSDHAVKKVKIVDIRRTDRG